VLELRDVRLIIIVVHGIVWKILAQEVRGAQVMVMSRLVMQRLITQVALALTQYLKTGTNSGVKNAN
jgi:hypothetical protein